MFVAMQASTKIDEKFGRTMSVHANIMSGRPKQCQGIILGGFPRKCNTSHQVLGSMQIFIAHARCHQYLAVEQSQHMQHPLQSQMLFFEGMELFETFANQP